MIDASLLMGLVVFLLAMGWYPCCCGGQELPWNCTYCTDTDYNVSLTITGFDDADCSCTELNAVWILEPYNGVNCQWDHTGNQGFTSMTCDTLTSVSYRITAQPTTLGLGYGWEAIVQVTWNSGGTNEYVDHIWFTLSSPWDCTATHALTEQTDTSGTACDGSGVSMTIN